MPLGWKAKVVAAQLSLGEQGVLSHRGAAQWWGLEGVPQGFVEFVHPRKAELAGLTLHRSRNLEICDVRRLSLVNVTKVERTLVDLGAVLPEDRIEEALESALIQRLTTFDRVADRARDLSAPGVRGIRKVMNVLHRRDPHLAATESVFETRFWRLLNKSSLPAATRQHKVFDLKGFVARLDVAWPQAKVAVEAISRRHHLEMFAKLERDSRRHNRLMALGWRILYEPWDALNNGAEEAIARLTDVLIPRLDAAL